MMNLPELLVWLAIGGLLGLFSFGKWMVPLAGWLIPVFLLHFMRGADPITGALGIFMVTWITISIANRGILYVPGTAYYVVSAIFAASYTLPYLADRLVGPHLPGFAATLVFPLAWVMMELIVARTNPFGTWGAVAYSQYNNQPLMQLASVAGLGGIAFLITWFGSVVNWAWNLKFDWAVIQTGVLIYAGVWVLVMLGGGLRLALANSHLKKIRVAALGWPGHIIQESEMYQSLEPNLTAEERQHFAQKFQQLHDWFLEGSQREARAGAKIVVWPENNIMVYAEDQAAFMQRAKQLARQEQVYLSMGIATVRLGEARPVEPTTVLVDSSGEVASTYIKNRLVPGWEASHMVAGDGRIRTVDSPHGRIASVICYDMDFPFFIRQVGKAAADILLVPASDPEQTGLLHSRIAVFRAVENGVSMVRPARWGVHSAVDPYGRTMATMEEDSVEQRVMVAQVPTRGVRTVYSRVGDLFAWLCAVGFLGSAVWAVF